MVNGRLRPGQAADVNRRIRHRFLVMAAALAGAGAAAQTLPNAPLSAPSGSASSSAVGSNAWSFSAVASTYLVPEDRDYVQPTVAAEHGRLHMEARYNYESLNTASAWVGWRFDADGALAAEITPMVGVVFGDTKGVAPGYKGSLAWRKLELSSESEYLFDTGNSSDSFFYNWSELTLAPAEWCRFGAVIQRTRAYKSDRDIQRGLLAGFSYRSFDLSVDVFNPDESRPLVVIALGLKF
jgi:hypothetical protein